MTELRGAVRAPNPCPTWSDDRCKSASPPRSRPDRALPSGALRVGAYAGLNPVSCRCGQTPIASPPRWGQRSALFTRASGGGTTIELCTSPNKRTGTAAARRRRSFGDPLPALQALERLAGHDQPVPHLPRETLPRVDVSERGLGLGPTGRRSGLANRQRRAARRGGTSALLVGPTPRRRHHRPSPPARFGRRGRAQHRASARTAPGGAR